MLLQFLKAMNLLNAANDNRHISGHRPTPSGVDWSRSNGAHPSPSYEFSGQDSPEDDDA